MNELIQSFFSTVATGGWIALTGFGAYLAYNLAVVTVITVGCVKAVNKIMDVILSRRTDEQKFMQLVASAGLVYPLTLDEWNSLIERVRLKS